MQPETMLNMSSINDLAGIEAFCWEIITEAASNRKIAMHQPVVATAVDGMAHMRTVVLRRADFDRKAVYFHTEFRSLKLQDIIETGRLSWLFYDQNISTQIRLSGPTIIHHKDELAISHWEKTGHHSRRSYLQSIAPSTIIDTPATGLDNQLATFEYTIEETEKGFDHFTVIETQATWMEWFFVHHEGNRRARFAYDSGQLKTAEWLIP
jgi:3-hydroxyisobutyrate dehydrogenase